MVEIVEKLAKETVIIYLTEAFRRQFTKGAWDHGILFWITPLLPERMLLDYKNLIPTKNIKKVLSIVSKNGQYLSAEQIERISFPKDKNPNFSTTLYLAILATRKGKFPSHEKTIGHLFHMGREESVLVGIWPVENRYHFRDLSSKEIKKKVIDELKLFTKPKLWESLLVLMFIEK